MAGHSAMLKSVLYDWGGLNIALFQLINGFHSVWWDRAMRLGTWVADHRTLAFVLGIVAVAFLRTSSRDTVSERFALAAGFAAAYVATSVLVWAAKLAVDFPRPAEALWPELTRVLVVPGDPYSFPSGHAARAAMTATLFWPYLKLGLRLAAVLAVAWIALSRIALGAHFPADVVAGAAIGVLVPRVLQSCLRRLLAAG